MSDEDCNHGEKMFVTDDETGEKQCIVCDVDRSFTLDDET